MLSARAEAAVPQATMSANRSVGSEGRRTMDASVGWVVAPRRSEGGQSITATLASHTPPAGLDVPLTKEWALPPDPEPQVAAERWRAVVPTIRVRRSESPVRVAFRDRPRSPPAVLWRGCHACGPKTEGGRLSSPDWARGDDTARGRGFVLRRG